MVKRGHNHKSSHGISFTSVRPDDPGVELMMVSEGGHGDSLKSVLRITVIELVSVGGWLRKLGVDPCTV